MSIHSLKSAIDNITYCHYPYPKEAVQYLVDHKDDPGVRETLLKTLQDLAQDPQQYIPKNNPGYMQHLYAMFLLAQFKEQAAYPLLINLLKLPAQYHEPGEPEEIMADVLCYEMDRILASVFDGNIEPLKEMIGKVYYNTWARLAALATLTLLYRNNAYSRSALTDYFKSLLLSPDIQLNRVFFGLAVCDLTDLHCDTLHPIIKTCFEKNLIAPEYMDYEIYIASQAEPNSQTPLIENTIDEMKNWSCFKELIFSEAIIR